MSFFNHTSSNKVVPRRYDCHPGDIIGKKYRVESILGEGAFGCVYKVVDTARTVWALKLLRLWDVPSDIRQQLIDRFEMEFNTGRIPSPNLVHSIDFGYLNGNPYIVMEFCDSGDLSVKIGKCGEDLVNYAKDILNGLNALHREGKVHRDLKPENVLLSANNIAKLTDFGISGDRNKRMTERNIFGKANQVFGTYAYMPPEQVKRGKSTVLPTTDIFSFGVVIYQLITGVLPFGELNDHNDLVRYQKRGAAGDWDRTSLLRSYNGEKWFAVIDGCLKANYKERLQTTNDVMRLLPYETNKPYNNIPLQRITTSNNGFILRIMQGLEFGKIYNLEELSNTRNCKIITVGRDGENIIQLHEYAEPYISRRHFTLEKGDNGSWTIRDGQWLAHQRHWQNSTNGTFVNSQEVSIKGIPLCNDDIISAGEIKIRYESL